MLQLLLLPVPSFSAQHIPLLHNLCNTHHTTSQPNNMATITNPEPVDAFDTTTVIEFDKWIHQDDHKNRFRLTYEARQLICLFCDNPQRKCHSDYERSLQN